MRGAIGSLCMMVVFDATGLVAEWFVLLSFSDQVL